MSRTAAVIPCHEEGTNPVALAAVLLNEGIGVIFVDDASTGESRRVLAELADDPHVTVVRNERRAGKSAAVLRGFEHLAPDVTGVLMIDCDVTVSGEAVRRMCDALEHADLVACNLRPIPVPRTVTERGAIFSARLQEALRARRFDRYPARYASGRCLGLSRRLVDAARSVPMPSHTEDAHLALLCIERGMRLAYCAEAEIFMRAPATLHEYLLQSDRYSEGESLLAAYWPQSVVKRWYRLRAIDVLGATLAQSARTPGDAIVWAAMYAVKLVPFRRREAAGPAWPVSNSTKHLRT